MDMKMDLVCVAGTPQFAEDVAQAYEANRYLVKLVEAGDGATLVYAVKVPRIARSISITEWKHPEEMKRIIKSFYGRVPRCLLEARG